MPHLIFQTCPRDIGQNSDRGISDFRISGESLHNSRTCEDIVMKLGRITRHDKRNKQRQKNWLWCLVNELWRHCHFLSLWPILEQSGSWIRNAWSVKLTFSLITTFYYRKTENRTKNFSTQLSHPKNTDFLQKQILTSANLREPWY